MHKVRPIGIPRFLISEICFGLGASKLSKNLISLINVNRKKILLVGDTNHDSEVAEVLGIDCILIYSGHQSVKILQKSNRKIIKNLKELLK